VPEKLTYGSEFWGANSASRWELEVKNPDAETSGLFMVLREQPLGRVGLEPKGPVETARVELPRLDERLAELKFG